MRSRSSPGTRGWAVAEVPHAGDVQPIATAADLEVAWVVRNGRPRGAATIQAVRRHWRLAAADDADDTTHSTDTNATTDTNDADVWETSVFSSSGEAVAADPAEAALSGPDETYAWVAGDSDTVKAIRRILVGEVGMARHHVAFMGYWKVGAAQL